MASVCFARISLGLGLVVISRKHFYVLVVIESCKLLMIVTLLLAIHSVIHIIYPPLKFAFPFCFLPRTTASVFTLSLN